MSEYLLGIYKEVGKNPEVIKIKNQKEYLEKLLDGEITTLDYDDYTIIYKKASDNLLANVYVNQYSKIGISLKGKIFAVGKDENGNFLKREERLYIIPDRKKAIRKAFSLCQKDDIVLLLGKAHENSIIYKDYVMPYDEISEAEKALSEMGY